VSKASKATCTNIISNDGMLQLAKVNKWSYM